LALSRFSGATKPPSRRAVADVKALIKADPKLQVVIKDFRC